MSAWLKVQAPNTSKDGLETKTDEELIALHSQIDKILRSRGYAPSGEIKAVQDSPQKSSVPSGYYLNPKNGKLYRMKNKIVRTSRNEQKCIIELRSAQGAMKNHAKQIGLSWEKDKKDDPTSGYYYVASDAEKRPIDLEDESFFKLSTMVQKYRDALDALRACRAAKAENAVAAI